MVRPRAGLCVRSLVPASLLRPSSGVSFLAASHAGGPCAGAGQHPLLAGRPAGSRSTPAEIVRSNVRRLVVTCPELLSWLLTAPRRPHSGAFPCRQENPGSLRPPRRRTESCQSLPTRIVKGHHLGLKGAELWSANALPVGAAPGQLSAAPHLAPRAPSAPGVSWSCVLTHILLPKACSAPRAPSKAIPSSQQIS